MQGKSIIKLLAILLVCIGSIYGVNALTAPIIEKNNANSANGALLKVMPDASGFETLYSSDNSDNSSITDAADTITGIYKENNGLGYVVTLATNQGYTHDFIEFTLGFDNEGKICGVDLTSYPESRDFGQDTYPLTYVGQDSTLADISLVAGVTYSSSAFKNATADAFNVLINNNLLSAGEMSDEQILTQIMVDNFSSMTCGSGMDQYEEISADGYDAAFKAINGAGYGFIKKDGDASYLIMVNNDGIAIVLDTEGNVVTDKNDLTSAAIAYQQANATAVSKKELKKLIKLVDENAEAKEISMGQTYNNVIKAYEINGKYAFIAKTYGFSNKIMTHYCVLSANGAIETMTADEIAIETEYFSGYSLDEAAYRKGFVGLTADTYTGDQAFISGATISTDAFKFATASVFETYEAIKGE